MRQGQNAGMLSPNGDRRPHIPRALVAAFVAVAASGWHGALAANGLERALERLQPCQGLKVNVRLATIGVDNLEKLSVEEVTITVKGDAADAAVTGTLACKTSDAALVRGDASARFSATVHMDLATCTVSGQKVEILSTGGTFGSLVDRFRGMIGRTLETGLADQLRKLCQ